MHLGKHVNPDSSLLILSLSLFPSLPFTECRGRRSVFQSQLCHTLMLGDLRQVSLPIHASVSSSGVSMVLNISTIEWILDH